MSDFAVYKLAVLCHLLTKVDTTHCISELIDVKAPCDCLVGSRTMPMHRFECTDLSVALYLASCLIWPYLIVTTNPKGLGEIPQCWRAQMKKWEMMEADPKKLKNGRLQNEHIKLLDPKDPLERFMAYSDHYWVVSKSRNKRFCVQRRRA